MLCMFVALQAPLLTVSILQEALPTQVPRRSGRARIVRAPIWSPRAIVRQSLGGGDLGVLENQENIHRLEENI